MPDFTIVDLALKTDQLLSRVDALLLGRVLVATQEYRTETTKADPGVGRFRLNNATLANVTQIYMDDTDTAGSSIAPLIDTYDDSTSTVKGTLILKSLDNANNWAAYRIVGTIVNETGYRSMTVEHIVSSGVWTAGENFSQDFRRSGDVGQSNVLSIGTVELGEEFSAEIVGAAPNQTLNIVVPPGPQGEIGPSPNIEIGNVYEGPAAVTLLGESPNYVLNITVPKGNIGNTGPRGFSLLYGAGAPDNATGLDTEFYIDTDNHKIFGPKAFGVWPAGVNIKGPKGDTGDPGVNANTILNGAGPPGADLGVVGDFYIDNSAIEIYGPKTLAGWGDPQDIRGPSGAGSGDVTGPIGVTTNTIVTFDGATGKVIKSGGKSIATMEAERTVAIAAAVDPINTKIGAMPVRTANFTFTGYGARELISTEAGPVTGLLPENPSVGMWTLFADIHDFALNTFTLDPGDELLEGLSGPMTITRSRLSAGIVFVGGSKGWRFFR